jgi:hypothetical protein
MRSAKRYLLMFCGAAGIAGCGGLAAQDEPTDEAGLISPASPTSLAVACSATCTSSAAGYDQVSVRATIPYPKSGHATSLFGQATVFLSTGGAVKATETHSVNGETWGLPVGAVLLKSADDPNALYVNYAQGSSGLVVAHWDHPTWCPSATCSLNPVYTAPQ